MADPPNYHTPVYRLPLFMLAVAACRPSPPAGHATDGAKLPVALAATPPAAPTRPPDPDELCLKNQYLFGYLVEESPGVYSVTCGIGTGTPCDATSKPACDGNFLEFCYMGKRNVQDCLLECAALNSDQGTCNQRDDQAACYCCNEGEPDCTALTARPRLFQVDGL